jgi:hypothetical protein
MLRFGVLGLFVAGGCVVNTTPATPQQPMPPPSAYGHPGYVYYGAGQAPPPAPPQLPPAAKVNDPVNIGHLRQMAAGPSRCNVPREVAPGVFVHFDCFPYKRVAIAQKHATPQKLNLIKLGRVKWHPSQQVHGIAPGGGGGTVGAGEAPAAYPDLVDHRLNGTEGPIKDQGDVGACTAFALSSVIDNALRRANQNITTSPEHVWSHYGYPTMEDAASGNLNKGLTTNEALPYSGREACEIMRDASDDCGQSYGVRPGTAASDAQLQQRLRTADASNGHRVTKFEELEVSPPNIDEIVATLASGADLWVAFNLDSSKWINGRMPNNVIPDWTTPDGGHALAMSGYRKVSGGGYQFLIHNSWGVSWGDGGYAWLNQAMVEKWMHLAYKVTTDVQPAAPGTDVDCPGDQVLDSVTGKCVGICPDQSRPANGQCPNGPAPPPQPLPLPGLGGIIPGMPAIPGWFPAPPQPAQPNPPNPPPAPAPSGQPSQPPAWPWPVPSTLPPFVWPPK